MAQKQLKTVPMAPKAAESTSQLDALNTQLTTLTQEKEAFQAVANQAAARLLQIEQLAQPFTSRKFNWLTALAHLKDYIDIIRQIIEIIKGFKDQYIKPLPQNDATN